MGFLDYVEERRASGDKLLFPDLRPDSLGNPTGNFAKWFGRHLRKLGISDKSKDERKDFHAFRHSFKQACRDARIEEEVHDAITGHAPGNVGRRYGEVRLELKANGIAKVTYPGLDLPYLYIE
jgi:integrase